MTVTKGPALQISIPRTSITTTNSKPFTTYHIILSLPLRNHELNKRYNDFTALHSALVAETNQAPPTALPAKSWIKTTVSNPTYTEERRAGLEAYLRSILNASDGRWRQSSAWRTFLDLPKALSASSNGESGTRGRSGSTLAPADWLEAHREVKSQIHAARLVLKKRESAATAAEQHGLNAEAKGALVKAGTGIARCEDSLKALGRRDEGWAADGLGEGEIRRRRDLLTASRKEVEGLETVLRSLVVKSVGSGGGGGAGSGANAGAAASDADKELLWRGTGAAKPKGRVLGGKETDRTRELGNDGVLQLQKQIMVEQDQDVLELGKAVSRMKEMGILINEELVVQNEMLGRVEEDVDRVSGKIDIAKKRIAKIH